MISAWLSTREGLSPGSSSHLVPDTWWAWSKDPTTPSPRVCWWAYPNSTARPVLEEILHPWHFSS